MVANYQKVSTPLTFDLPGALVAKIHQCRRELGQVSASEVVRLAVARFDFAAWQPAIETHRQISVRLPAALKVELGRQAKNKKVSAGELLRAALTRFSARPLEAAGKNKATRNTMKKKSAKKPAKKTAGKKKKK